MGLQPWHLHALSKLVHLSCGFGVFSPLKGSIRVPTPHTSVKKIQEELETEPNS